MFKHNISIVDRTVQTKQKVLPRPIDENILIVGSFPKGRSNQLLQYYPGESQQFIDDFGLPNLHKTGVGPYIATMALNNDLNMGVAVVNLKPADATYANVVMLAKTVLKENVQAQNAQGELLYITPTGEETTIAGGNTPITRNVIEVSILAKSLENVKTDQELVDKMDALYKDEPSTKTKTYPIAVFHYPGPGLWGNNVHFRMVGKVSPYNNNVIYDIDLFNGNSNEEILSMTFDPTITAYPGSVSFIETIVKNSTSDIRVKVSKYCDDFYTAIGRHDTTNGRNINILAANGYYVTAGADNMDTVAPRAFQLANGNDGTMGNIDETIKKFFDGKIVEDILDITRYKIDIIPDLDYTDEIKKSIMNFCNARKKTTNAILMMGDEKTFESAVADKRTKFMTDFDTGMFFAKCQGCYKEDPFSYRSIKMPIIYYIMETYVEKYKLNGNSFEPFAGATVRIGGFDETTFVSPPFNDDFADKLEDNRINYVRLDAAPGAYIASQNTNTVKISDRMEFNNMRVTAQIIHMINQLAHFNGYKFNDIADVYRFNEQVDMTIRQPFSKYVSNISTTVYKKALFGIDKNTNYIDIVINFKDLSKQTNTQIILVDNI